MTQTRNREYRLTFNTGDTSASFKAELPFRGFNIFCGDRKDGRFIFDTGPNPGFISNILIKNEPQIVATGGMAVELFASDIPVNLYLPTQDTGDELIVLLTSPCTRPFTLLVQGVEKIS
jgi:hypothetical protein